MLSFGVQMSKAWFGPICISLVYFLLPWETGLRRFRFLWENALPAFFSGSSWCDLSYFSPQNIFCSFLLNGGHMDPNFSDSPISVWVPQTPLAEDSVFFPLGLLKSSFMFSHNILQKHTKEILANHIFLFPWWKINWLSMYGFVPGVSVLFHCLLGLFLCQDPLVWNTVAL